MDTSTLRAGLVAGLRATGVLTRADVAAAFSTVPRELFLPDYPAERAYSDEALVTKRDDGGMPISSSSQPSIMARMLEQLDVRAGTRVLEIGAGTGYNAALLAVLTGGDDTVVTVDIDEDTVRRARSGLTAAGHSGVRVVCADGALGHQETAPYDRIIATVGIWDISAQWIEQLKPGGILVAPIDLGGVQRSVAFRYDGTALHSESVVDCGFMRLRGSAAGPERMRTIDREAGRTVVAHDGANLDEITVALGKAPVSVSCGVRCTMREIFGGLMLWLSRGPGARVDVFENTDAPTSLLGNTVLDFGSTRMGPGIVLDDSVALLVAARRSSRLVAMGFGPRSVTVASRLVELVSTWDSAGRPSTVGLHVDAYPRGEAPTGRDGVIERPSTTLVLSWR